MAFLDAFRRRFRTPGFAGDTLEDQIARESGDINAPRMPTRDYYAQSPQDQVLTPQNQQAVTRPRRTYNTTLSPEEEQRFVEWKRQNAPNDSGEDYDLRGAFKAGIRPDAQSGHWPDTFKKPNHPTFSNESQYAMGADAARAGRWSGNTFEPPGSSSTFGQAFTRPRRTQPRDYIADDTQYLRDIENQPRNWRDKTVGVLDAVSAAFGNEPRRTLTRRERDLQQARGMLTTDIAVDRAQQGQMVPVTLTDGSVVQVPARTAGGLASRQQEIGLRGDTLQARKQRWDSLSSNERKKTIIAEYKAGMLNNDPRALEQAARELNIPGTMLPAFINGQMRDAIDDEGNIIQVNRQTGDVTSSGERSYEVTKEAGRERRAAAAQAGALQRAGMRGSGKPGGSTDKTAMRRAAQLVAQIDRARNEMEAADKAGNAKRKDEARIYGEQAASELNALGVGYEAGRGEGGYPYYKRQETQSAQQGGQYAGRRISRAKVPEFARRHGMGEAEALQYLKDQQAIVY